MLLLIFQFQANSPAFDRMASNDVAVILGNAVLGALQKGSMAGILIDKLSTNQLYVLSEDMVTMGIVEAELVEGLGVIDYSGLVNLTVENAQIFSWC